VVFIQWLERDYCCFAKQM